MYSCEKKYVFHFNMFTNYKSTIAMNESYNYKLMNFGAYYIFVRHI